MVSDFWVLSWDYVGSEGWFVGKVVEIPPTS
jgi:hypothetical protein